MDISPNICDDEESALISIVPLSSLQEKEDEDYEVFQFGENAASSSSEERLRSHGTGPNSPQIRGCDAILRMGEEELGNVEPAVWNLERDDDDGDELGQLVIEEEEETLVAHLLLSNDEEEASSRSSLLNPISYDDSQEEDEFLNLVGGREAEEDIELVSQQLSVCEDDDVGNLIPLNITDMESDSAQIPDEIPNPASQSDARSGNRMNEEQLEEMHLESNLPPGSIIEDVQEAGLDVSTSSWEDDEESSSDSEVPSDCDFSVADILKGVGLTSSESDSGEDETHNEEEEDRLISLFSTTPHFEDEDNIREEETEWLPSPQHPIEPMAEEEASGEEQIDVHPHEPSPSRLPFFSFSNVPCNFINSVEVEHGLEGSSNGEIGGEINVTEEKMNSVSQLDESSGIQEEVVEGLDLYADILENGRMEKNQAEVATFEEMHLDLESNSIDADVQEAGSTEAPQSPEQEEGVQVIVKIEIEADEPAPEKPNTRTQKRRFERNPRDRPVLAKKAKVVPAKRQNPGRRVITRSQLRATTAADSPSSSSSIARFLAADPKLSQCVLRLERIQVGSHSITHPKKGFRRYLRARPRFAVPRRKFKCTPCNKLFTRKDNLIRHLSTYTHLLNFKRKPRGKFNCDVCNRAFFSPDNLSQHQRTLSHWMNVSTRELVGQSNEPVAGSSVQNGPPPKILQIGARAKKGQQSSRKRDPSIYTRCPICKQESHKKNLSRHIRRIHNRGQKGKDREEIRKRQFEQVKKGKMIRLDKQRFSQSSLVPAADKPASSSQAGNGKSPPPVLLPIASCSRTQPKATFSSHSSEAVSSSDFPTLTRQPERVEMDVPNESIPGGIEIGVECNDPPIESVEEKQLLPHVSSTWFQFVKLSLSKFAGGVASQLGGK